MKEPVRFCGTCKRDPPIRPHLRIPEGSLSLQSFERANDPQDAARGKATFRHLPATIGCSTQAMDRRIARGTAFLLILLGVWLVFGFEANLHCTQDTSFALAAFDPEPHEEELEGGIPAVYGVLGVPLRAYLALSLLALLFVPAEGAFLVLAGRLGVRHWRAATFGFLTLVALNSTLPQKLIGERFQALGAIAVVVVLVPLCALAALLRAHPGRSGPQRPT